MEEVVSFCQALVPEAVTARSHGLIQSDYLWRFYAEHTSVRNECFTYIGNAVRAEPSTFYWKGHSLNRIPFVYQDNIEMEKPDPVWEIEKLVRGTEGTRLLNFYPFYVYLNSISMDAFEQLKARAPSMQDISAPLADEFRWEGSGTRSMFEGVTRFAAGGRGAIVKEICQSEEPG